jgi:hypothetical protein
MIKPYLHVFGIKSSIVRFSSIGDFNMRAMPVMMAVFVSSCGTPSESDRQSQEPGDEVQADDQEQPVEDSTRLSFSYEEARTLFEQSTTAPRFSPAGTGRIGHCYTSQSDAERVGFVIFSDGETEGHRLALDIVYSPPRSNPNDWETVANVGQLDGSWVTWGTVTSLFDIEKDPDLTDDTQLVWNRGDSNFAFRAGAGSTLLVHTSGTDPGVTVQPPNAYCELNRVLANAEP